MLINFLMGSVIGGVYEFIASYIQEKFTGTIGWDYSKLLLNIDGRTTIPFMFFWGFASVLLIYFITKQDIFQVFFEIRPLFEGLFQTNSYNFNKLICILFGFHPFCGTIIKKDKDVTE